MSEQVWLDGQLVDEEGALVPALGRGWTVGYGVFETLLAHHGTPFALTRHYQRLEDSAQVVGLAIPALATLRDGCAQVLEANCRGVPRARLRITVAQGRDEPVVTITAVPAEPVAATAVVVFSPFRRNPNSALTGVKATSYAENTLALAEAKVRGGDEGLLANTDGRLCEGTTSNVFVVRSGTLTTPPLSSGCLPGVTRGLVLELAAKEGIPTAEQDLPCEALVEAGEAFLTSSTREVQPIARVDRCSLPVAPGEITRQLQNAFRGLREREVDP